MAKRFGHAARSVMGLAALLPLTWSVALPAQPLYQSAPSRGCAVYEHAQFAGQRRDVFADDRVAWVGPQWNDRISSVACDRGCTLTGYEHIDFGGAAQRFDRTAANVGAFWNDRISSMRVECAGPGNDGGFSRAWGGRSVGSCTLYEHAGFAGARIEVRADDAMSAMRPGWNDRVSSLQCAPDCEVVAFEHNDYGGEARTLRGATPNLGTDWNDRISSLRISCR